MHGYISRRSEADVHRALQRSPAVAVLGPRQCGKSTLARHCLLDVDAEFLDLQSRPDRARLEEPELFFEHHRGRTVCLDEIQQVPELFSVLRAEIDADRRPGRFLILGSASRDLLRQSTESLAGRIAYLDLTPFLLSEVHAHAEWDRCWLRGGFPDSLLARDDADSYAWRQDFIRTFLERDLAQLGAPIPAPVMGRLWRLLAHYHGQVLNYSKVAGAADLTVPTLKRYLGILEQTYMLRLLPPSEANLKKRLVRSPKLYLRDSGIVHALLDIESYDHLLSHPGNGASWEGLMVEHLIAYLPQWRPSFLRTSNGAEADLIMERAGKVLMFEFKMSKAPKVSRGFQELYRDLEPQMAAVVAPVGQSYDLGSGIRVLDPTDLETVL